MALYNCFAGIRRSQEWSNAHRAIDYATPIGTPVRAPEDGVYVRCASELSRTNKTAAGVYGYIRFANGDRIYFCHLKKHVAKNGASVVKGELLAYTGNTGYVRPTPTLLRRSLGAHMHTYGVRANGARFDWTVGAAASCTGTVTARGNLRLRTKASTKTGKFVRWVPYGARVAAIGFSGKWWKIRYGDKTGYVHAAYLK